MDIDALRILNQLPLHRGGVVQLYDAGGERKQFRKLGRAKAPCPCNDFESAGVRTDGDGLNQTMLPDRLG
jgi:hypothetical protein